MTSMLTAWVYPSAQPHTRNVWTALVGVLGTHELPGLDLTDVEDYIRGEVRARNAPAQVRYVPAIQTLTVWFPEDDEEMVCYEPTWYYLLPAACAEA